ADQTQYQSRQLARQDCHSRGADLTVMDLNLIRPIDFAVIDGIWGMEGQGPILGTPVASNVVLAGVNPVAVDRIGLHVMKIPQTSVAHLAYAGQRGLGPVNLSNIRLHGDSLIQIPFTRAVNGPMVWKPQADPVSISLSAGEQTTLSYKV